MKFKNLVIILASVLLTLSCSRGEDSIKKDENSQFCYRLDDSTEICKKFSNGILVDSTVVINNKIHGVRMAIDFNDNIVLFLTYKKGVLNGYSRSYYFNGQKCNEGEYAFGKKIGYWNQWDSEGKLTKVVCFSVKEQEPFVIEYDNALKISGDGILDVKFDIANDSLITVVDVASPNETKGILMI